MEADYFVATAIVFFLVGFSVGLVLLQTLEVDPIKEHFGQKQCEKLDMDYKTMSIDDKTITCEKQTDNEYRKITVQLQ